MTSRTSYRLGWGLALLTALFLVWAIGALGIIGAGGRPDRMYAGVLAVLVLGSLLARLRARGMAWTLAAAAGAMCLVALVAFARGLHEVDGASVPEILGLTAMYAAMFGASGWLFWRAARTR